MYGYTVFHKKLINTLIETVRAGTNANTYIFEGADGLKKHDAALLFAKALVCEEKQSAPCCECSACVEAQAGTHPDIVHIKRDKATLGVDPIRRMITECMIKPFYNRHKVFIIDEGDLLTPQAQNAFLKIIEEPPEYAVFIIVCTNSQILLETVRSRAVTITFPPVSDNDIRDYIETAYPDETRIDFLVGYSMGIPGNVDKIIKRTDFDELREEVLNIVPRLLSKNKIHAFDFTEYIDTHKDNAAEIYDIILLYLRDALITSTGKADKIINTDKADKINLLVSKYTAQSFVSASDEIMLAKKMIERHVKVAATALHAALCVKGS